MNVAFFEVNEKEKRILSPRNNLKIYESTLNNENVEKIKDCEIISVFIYSKINKEILEKLPNLKLIATRSTGTDHIDINFCKEKGIEVLNVSGYGEGSVAEHTFALILSISRQISKADRTFSREKGNIYNLPCFDLKDKTIGIIGTGKIGAAVIRIARGFGLKIIAYDVYKNPTLLNEGDFNYVSLEELAKNSDIITLHVPLTKETFHLIDQEFLGLIKKGVVIINTCRGAVIDTSALLEALNSEKVGWAGLDVFEGEELLMGDSKKKNQEIYELINHEKVLITPHMAFYSTESNRKILDKTLENINNFIRNFSDSPEIVFKY